MFFGPPIAFSVKSATCMYKRNTTVQYHRCNTRNEYVLEYRLLCLRRHACAYLVYYYVPMCCFFHICTLFCGARGFFLALSAAGYAGGPPVHHGASVGPGRAP